MAVNTPVELYDYRDVARPSQVDANQAEIEPVDERASRAAAQLRVADAAIERMPFDLSTLEDGGVFINVDARNFGLLDRRLDWQTLGIACHGTPISRSARRAVDSFPTDTDCPCAPRGAGPFGAPPTQLPFNLSRPCSRHPPIAGCPGERGVSLSAASRRAVHLRRPSTRTKRTSSRFGRSTRQHFQQLASESSRRLGATGLPVVG